MREILFRGKETQGNKWAYGSLVEFNERTFLSDNNLAHKVPSEMWNFHTFEGFCEVIPSTVGQYTGLTDKNGTKIFEGDIIKWDAIQWGSEHSEVVEWEYDLLAIRKSDWREFTEVIGNVWDGDKNDET